MSTLTHHFKNICYDIPAIFNKCNTLSKFMNNLEVQSQLDPDRFSKEKYVGFGFESLIEMLIKSWYLDPRINIKGYEPILSDDMGVDGIGYGHDGEAHTVQIKYRSNTDQVLTANRDHISNFVAHSLAKYNAKHMTIFTTANTLMEVIANEMYNNKVRTIGFKDLKLFVDGNYLFWEEYRDRMMTQR